MKFLFVLIVSLGSCWLFNIFAPALAARSFFHLGFSFTVPFFFLVFCVGLKIVYGK